MTWERPTLSELVTRAVSDIQTRITGSTTLLRRSVLRVLAKVQAGANHLLYGYLEYIANGIFILTSDEYQLRSHAIEWGVDRDPAAEAVGNVIITGTTALIVPAGTELQSADGQKYTTDEAATLVAGTVTTAITASVAGADGNQDAAIVLTFVSPIDGIDANATVDSDGLNDGEDIEDVEDWRDKISARKKRRPHGGAENDYVEWMLEVAGVTRAWCFPLYNGVGTVGCAFVRDAESPIVPSTAEIEVVEAYIIEHVDPATGETVGIPVTAEPGLFVIELSELPVDITIGIYPNTAAIQSAITKAINDALVTYGGPGETVYLSQLQKAISAAVGLDHFTISSPLANIDASQTQVHVPGTYTYTDYS